MSTFLSKVGKILPVKEKFFAYYFSSLKFCPILPGHMRFLVPISARWVGVFDKMVACSLGHVPNWGWGGLTFLHVQLGT